MSDINDLIKSALDQDYNKANQVFGDLMGEKIDDALDQEKAKIASQIYGDGEPEEDLVDDEDLEDLIDDEDLEGIEDELDDE